MCKSRVVVPVPTENSGQEEKRVNFGMVVLCKNRYNIINIMEYREMRIYKAVAITAMAVYMAVYIFVDGNGEFLGLPPLASMILAGTVAAIGLLCSIFIVLHSRDKWRAVAAAFILLYLLSILLFFPSLGG